MAKPRSEIIAEDEVGVYHCYTRITRRRHLLGVDAVTGKDYSYRKGLVRKELRRLAKVMAIQVLDYAILDNHLHNVLRNRPDIVKTWSDEEVIRRWWSICPRRRRANGEPAELTEADMLELRERVDELRKNLSSISWFMRLALQRIAQRANREDQMDGRFFADRFRAKRLVTEADVLNCCIYVNLNWIHADKAETQETSYYTSGFERIRSKWSENAKLLAEMKTEEGDNFDGDWLAPVFIDERADAYVSSKDVPPERTLHDVANKPVPPWEFHEHGEAKETTIYNSLGDTRVSNRGFLPIKLQEYLKLIDEVGRRMRPDKRGSIPPEMPPILERLGLEPKRWLTELLDWLDATPNIQLMPVG